MKKRHKLSKAASRGLFRGTSGSKLINWYYKPTRGGIRL